MTEAFSELDYQKLRIGTQSSADVIVPYLQGIYQPESVLDVGCGEGWFAKKFIDLGVQARGIDFDVPRMAADGVRITPSDLSQECSLVGLTHASLVLCLEVAEHLPPERGPSLVEELCLLALGAVVFSAAVPGQGGHGHVNCRWPSYWIPLFARSGFYPDDHLRRTLWNDARIEPWYRQNLLVFTPIPAPRIVEKVLDLVHPEIFAWYAS